MKNNKWKRKIGISLGAVCLASNIVMVNAAEVHDDKEINNKIIQDAILGISQDSRNSFCKSEKKEKYSCGYNTLNQKHLNFEFDGKPKRIKTCEIFFADVTHNNTKKTVIFIRASTGHILVLPNNIDSNKFDDCIDKLTDYIVLNVVHKEDREKFEKECWEKPEKITGICNNKQDSSNSLVEKWKTLSPEKQLIILAVSTACGFFLGRNG